MLDYTKVALGQIKKDVKNFAFAVSIVTQLIYIAYLVYALFTKKGIFRVNLFLLVLSVGYTAFYIYATVQEMQRTIKRRVRVVYKRCKQLIRLYTLGVMIYGLALTAKTPSPFAIVFAVMMIFGFVMDVLIELIAKYFNSRTDMLFEAIKADFEAVTKPAQSVGNFFKKLAGKEVKEEEPPTRTRQNLDKQVEELRDERRNKKLEMHYLRRKKKEERKAQKQTKRAEKKNG